MNCTLRPSGHEGGDTELAATIPRKGKFEEGHQRLFVQTNKLFPDVQNINLCCYHHLGLELGRDRQENSCVRIITDQA